MKLRTAPFGAILFLLSACAAPPIERPAPGKPDATALIDYTKASIETLMSQDDVPGVSVVLVTPDGWDNARNSQPRNSQQWSKGFGWASKDDDQALTANTPMRLASVTKVLTAVAIMQLVEDKQIGLDAPLRKYLPEFSVQSRFANDEITIRQLLTHHSGLPSDRMAGFKLYTGVDAAPSDLVDQFRRLPKNSKDLHLASEPGAVFSYSNLGFALLGSVIERVSGLDYWSYIDERILIPLGMTDSAIIYPGHVSGVDYANGLTDSGEVSVRHLRDISAGGLTASAKDMGKFIQLLLGGYPEILSLSSVAAMSSPQFTDNELNGDSQYGLSLFLSHKGQSPFVAGHRGDGFPYHASLQILPSEEVGILVATNSSAGQNLVNQVTKDVLQAAYAMVTKPPTEQDVANLAIPSNGHLANVETYEGLYFAGPDLGIVEVHAKSSDLYLDFYQTRLANAKLIPAGTDRFDIKLRLFGFVPLPVNLVMGGVQAPHFQLQFQTIADTQYLWLTTDGIRGAFPLAVPLKKAPVSTTWHNRVGRYTPEKPSQTMLRAADLWFDPKSGFLTVRFENDVLYPRDLPLDLLSDTQAAIPGFGRFGGEVLEADNDTLSFAGVRFIREG
ncbi:MAG: serine hydrolase [Pseudomonadales bacterium]|nr:serine hydrolase [Pseudomonadales bacterium]